MNKEFYRGEIFYIRNESEYSGNVQGGETCGNHKQ